MKCPGSVSLSRGIEPEEGSAAAALGTSAHALAAACLLTGEDAWEKISETFCYEMGGATVDEDMANAVQVYLDYCREPEFHQGEAWVERHFHCPPIHPMMYGTSDFTRLFDNAKLLRVVDYKHGAGIVVEAKQNVQCMYYAAGMLSDLDLWDQIETIELVIVQPRGFHTDGPIRTWTMSTDALAAWVDDELVPAMNWAATSNETVAGDHCRFCPVRFCACPALLATLDELEITLAEMQKAGGAEELTNEQVARYLNIFEVAKIGMTAANKTAFNRLQAGQTVPGYKLVPARSNRTWKEGAEAVLVDKFGVGAYTDPELKSPAQIDKLPEGTALTTKHAFKPDAGLTVAKADDNRTAVSKDTKSMFQDVTKRKRNSKGE